MQQQETFTRSFDSLNAKNTAMVGGKNASLGEMISRLKEKGIRVPEGFATTAEAYWDFVDANSVRETIQEEFQSLRSGEKFLEDVGETIRKLFRAGRFSPDVEQSIREAYRTLGKRYKSDNVDVAVRSSATAEDLPEASFAGQQESFLNITGEDDLLDACRKCYASLFTDRAINYRKGKGFDHLKVALSVGVQKMVRSDKACSGVMFTLDTDTGFREVVVINGSWGLGENVVQGAVNPDEYVVFKPFLEKKGVKPIIEKHLGEKAKKMIYTAGGSRSTKNIDTPRSEQSSFVLADDEILDLARWAKVIEEHYGKPMDIEWAKDGERNEMYIVQARPETVQARKEASLFKTYTLREQGKRIVTGLSIGQAIAAGKAIIMKDVSESDRFEDGAILVTEMTDPDWGPLMARAGAIVTDHGGRTSHAAIVSRELGLPAVVGSGNATDILKDGQEVTVSCAEGDEGFVYEGRLEFDESEIDTADLPDTRTRIMMNIASPAGAFRWWKLPCKGIGLARMEFIINNIIKIHPMALVHPDRVEDDKAEKQINEMTRGYEDKTEYFVSHLARGIAKIAASQYPSPVIVRMSDFKTNEYANLIGGKYFEPHEDNPMLGFRGASRYYSERYREGFVLECRAIQRVREEIGFDNVIIMIPFCRTVGEADRVLEVLAENGLRRGERGLEVYVMCEIPSNVILADAFADRFDGFSIGSNDLTQLVLGIDRDSGELAELFDERNEAVKQMIRMLIPAAHAKNRKVGICGQAPSDYPDFAAFLVGEGIDSISLNPDTVIEVRKRVAEEEKKKK